MNKDRGTDTGPLLKEMGILNIYQLNLYQILIFMFKLKNEMTPEFFQNQFSLIKHRYPTRFSKNSYQVPRTSLRKTNFSITCRGPRLWNNILPTSSKSITSINSFKNTIKRDILNLNNEKEHF